MLFVQQSNYWEVMAMYVWLVAMVVVFFIIHSVSMGFYYQFFCVDMLVALGRFVWIFSSLFWFIGCLNN